MTLTEAKRTLAQFVTDLDVMEKQEKLKRRFKCDECANFFDDIPGDIHWCNSCVARISRTAKFEKDTKGIIRMVNYS